MNFPRPFKVHFFGLQTLYISLGLLLLGSSLQITLLSMRGRLEGFPDIVIGMIGSAYFMGYLLGCRKVPKFVERVAHIRTFAGLAALCTCIAMAYTLWVNAYFWMFLRFSTGFCMAGLYVVVESWVNQMAVNSNRGAVISQYRLVDIGANLAAQSLLFVFDVSGTQLFSLFGIFLAASVIPITMTRTVVPDACSSVKVPLREVFRKIPFPAWGCFVLGLVNSSLWALSPLFVTDAFHKKEAVPMFGICYLIGGFLLQPSIGKWSDRKDRRVFIVVFSALTAIVTFFIPFMATLNENLFWPYIVLYGCMSVPIYSLCIALANDQSDPKNFLRVSSALLFSYGLGAIQGPTYAGMIITAFGSKFLFYFISSGFTVFSIYGMYRLSKKKPVLSVQADNYLGIPVEGKAQLFQTKS